MKAFTQLRGPVSLVLAHHQQDTHGNDAERGQQQSDRRQ